MTVRGPGDDGAARRGPVPSSGHGDREVSARRAAVIRVGVWSFILSASLAAAATVLGRRLPAAVLLVQALGLVAGVSLLRLVGAGRERLATAGVIILGWLAITYIVGAIGTVRAPVIGHYLLCVTLAGMEFGVVGLVGTIVACSVTVAGLVFAEVAGWLPAPDFTTNVTQWINATALFASMGFMTHGSSRLLDAALERAEDEVGRRRVAEAELRARIEELRVALEQVKTLSGLLPLCGSCGKVREDDGYWRQFERFVESRTDARFTHGICPECRRLHFPGREGDSGAS